MPEGLGHGYGCGHGWMNECPGVFYVRYTFLGGARKGEGFYLFLFESFPRLSL